MNKTILILMALFFIPFVFAVGESVELSIPEQVDAGQEFDIEIIGTDLSEVSGYEITLKYDTTAMQVLSINTNSVLKEMGSINEITENKDGYVFISEFLTSRDYFIFERDILGVKDYIGCEDNSLVVYANSCEEKYGVTSVMGVCQSLSEQDIGCGTVNARKCSCIFPDGVSPSANSFSGDGKLGTITLKALKPNATEVPYEIKAENYNNGISRRNVLFSTTSAYEINERAIAIPSRYLVINGETESQPEEQKEVITIADNSEVEEGNVNLLFTDVDGITSGNIEITETITNPVSVSVKNPLNKFVEVTSDVEFNKVRLVVKYLDSDIGSLDESTLRVYYYNTITAAWEILDGGVDIANNEVYGDTTHFSLFGVFGDNVPAAISPSSSSSSGSSHSGGSSSATRVGVTPASPKVETPKEEIVITEPAKQEQIIATPQEKEGLSGLQIGLIVLVVLIVDMGIFYWVVSKEDKDVQ